MNPADLLLEIGTEELPAAYLPGLIEQLDREATVILEARHLSFQAVHAYGAPRRLVLIVRGLGSVQHTPGTEIRGPSKQAAYDAAGTPTPALLGFLRSQGGAVAQTKVVSTDKGAYVYLTKPPTTTPTITAVPDLLPQLIGRLRAPKTMRWNDSGVRFARPIRWLLALYRDRPIRFAHGRLKSGTVTWVGRPQRLARRPVTSLAGYLATLARDGIILDHAKRRAVIERAVAKIAAASKGAAAPEMVTHGLLDEVTHLAEHPVPLAGGFDAKYLSLPREVLLASMAKYQRVFAIERGGKTLPAFVAILEGTPGKPAHVREIIERILNARLADSLLFFEQDRKRPLSELAAALTGVTFHEKLGSMADKVGRLHKFAAALERPWNLSAEELCQLRRACELAKADLVSTLVKEFPTLQGVMGKYYALAAGEPPAVAAAIEEHYLPLAGRSPATLIGSALSILDKYDTLAGYFSVGIMPTGDQDPFGLRRAAQGIVEVGWAMHRPLSLDALFAAWRTCAPAKIADDLQQRVRRYVLERLYTFAWPQPAPGQDLIEAVLAAPCDDVVDAMERVLTLQRLSGKPALRKAAKVIERTRNILKGTAVRQRDVDTAKFQAPPERRLWELYETHQPRVAELAEKRQYAEATTLFGDTFFEPLHVFFDEVMVNVPDEALQQNRLALMQAIHTLYTGRIADLSKLTLLQHDEEPAP